MDIETINGVEYLKLNEKYYKLTLCDIRDVNKSRAFHNRNEKQAEIRRMICFDYSKGMSKKDMSIKYNKSTTRINQILKKGCEMKEVQYGKQND